MPSHNFGACSRVEPNNAKQAPTTPVSPPTCRKPGDLSDEFVVRINEHALLELVQQNKHRNAVRVGSAKCVGTRTKTRGRRRRLSTVDVQWHGARRCSLYSVQHAAWCEVK